MEIGSDKWKRIILSGAGDLNISVDSTQVDQFAIHARELLHWNQKINLTAVTDPLNVAVKHYLDSIAPANLLPHAGSLLDIGAGGGFPGIPLKILLPSLSVTLIDASRKKVSFLKHAGRALGLSGLKVLHIRAEDLRRHIFLPPNDRRSASTIGKRPPAVDDDSLVQPFNVIVSRALTSLDQFVLLALPLIATDGMMIALKGRISEPELSSARRMLHTRLNPQSSTRALYTIRVEKYRLPIVKSRRALVVIKTDH
jgi:16S rRNA (guanine527-N7)-methyltransferase